MKETKPASIRTGAWLSAAMDDPSVCEEMKKDINEGFPHKSPGYTNLDPAEIWGAAQLSPGEGISDGISRIEKIIAIANANKNQWQPIETAPKDNKRKLYLARINENGKILELDYDGTWEYWSESWELPHINGYAWFSASGIEEPTHWAYQE